MLLPLSRAAVAAVLPAQTLSDLVAEPHDLENDFHVLLDFWQPYYGTHPAEPSARVRAAARRCLKDPSHHADFVQLLLNTIRTQFYAHFRVECETGSLRRVSVQVHGLQEYYARQSAVLNLSELAAQSLSRGINGYFCRYLHSPRLLAELEALVSGYLSDSVSERANSVAVANSVEVANSAEGTDWKDKHRNSGRSGPRSGRNDFYMAAGSGFPADVASESGSGPKPPSSLLPPLEPSGFHSEPGVRFGAAFEVPARPNSENYMWGPSSEMHIGPNSETHIGPNTETPHRLKSDPSKRLNPEISPITDLPPHGSADSTPSSASPADAIAILHTLASVGMAEAIQTMVVQYATASIQAHVVAQCAGNWSRAGLGPVQSWVHERLAPAVQAACSTRTAFADELVSMARNELISLRTAEIFGLVAAYPQSAPALSELHFCLVQAQNTLARARLVDSFVSLCHRRLLNSASNTVDIVLSYTKTLKAFLVVDPTGVLLDKVARPMRRYLKGRPDLVPQLVRAMLDRDPCTNRLVELADAIFTPAAQLLPSVDDLSDRDWCPDPIDALPDFRKRKVLDSVQALTSIVHSTSVFVDEFTSLFADRLLSADHSPQSVLDYVQHLKARFGAGEFATLDVMIRDITESMRLNAELGRSGVGAGAVSFSASVLSKMYWPSVHDNLSENDYFSVPVQAEFEAFAEKYREIKKGRALTLIPSLGSVTVELCVQDAAKDYVVTPAQAKVIEVFDDDMDCMSLATVAMACSMPQYVTAQALKYWVQAGVLMQEKDQYRAAQ